MLASPRRFAVVPNQRQWEAVAMGKHRIKPNYRRRVLRLPDLDHCKLAVLNSLGSPASRRVYEYAIHQFIAWSGRSGIGGSSFASPQVFVKKLCFADFCCITYMFCLGH